MSFKQEPFKLITEACKGESFEVDSVEDDEIECDFEDAYGDVEELEDDIEYTEEMVNVFQQPTKTGFRYLVEFDTLSKYMISANIQDVATAINNIAECNSLSKDDMVVVIESDDYTQEYLEEAKKLKKVDPKKKKMKEAGTTAQILKMMKSNGIKLAKKKSKGKKKKK
jgi:hypothetical protein